AACGEQHGLQWHQQVSHAVVIDDKGLDLGIDVAYLANIGVRPVIKAVMHDLGNGSHIPHEKSLDGLLLRLAFELDDQATVSKYAVWLVGEREQLWTINRILLHLLIPVPGTARG